MRTRVKICGITRPQDATLSAQSGADAIGLMFYQNSSRAITISQAQDIIAALPPYITVTGIFVNAAKETVDTVLNAVNLHILQFHGDEPPAYCDAFTIPYIKVLRMQAGADLKAFINSYPNAAGFLLDTYEQKQRGGTGKTFDWTQIPSNPPKPIILAGGLTPENVQQAIAQVHPYGVDVSSGVESSAGIKDPVKLKAFINAVNQRIEL